MTEGIVYSTFSHCSQETFSTETMRTGHGTHGHFEHLLTDGAEESIFDIGIGRRELLIHCGECGMKETAGAVAKVVVARFPTPHTSADIYGSYPNPSI